ncbi:MAG: ornithine carbamoyltransferase [Oscillospiraceae bacterium]
MEFNYNKKNNLLKMADLTKEEIIGILNLADQLKFENKNNISHNGLLKGKSLGMIFEKASTRTRVSFEVGMYQLGGSALFLSGNDLQIGRGEPIEDTARVLDRYLDGIMIRTFKHSQVEQLASCTNVPIINGLTDYCHPCQVLADLMTIREFKGSFDGLKMCYIGDGNNMANSLIVGGLTVGMKVNVATPIGYEPDKQVLLTINNNPNFMLTNDIISAAKDADVVITDVWASMGQETEKTQRINAFKGFQINDQVLSCAKNDAMVLHCLPAHREEEITAKVFEAHANEIFEEAENRLHAQKAVMVKLMSDEYQL